jgi:hypothetical protein
VSSAVCKTQVSAAATPRELTTVPVVTPPPPPSLVVPSIVITSCETISIPSQPMSATFLTPGLIRLAPAPPTVDLSTIAKYMAIATTAYSGVVPLATHALEDPNMFSRYNAPPSIGPFNIHSIQAIQDCSHGPTEMDLVHMDHWRVRDFEERGLKHPLLGELKKWQGSHDRPEARESKWAELEAERIRAAGDDECVVLARRAALTPSIMFAQRPILPLPLHISPRSPTT